MTYKTEAIILRSFDINEYDRMYTIFSKEHGKMCVLGIGTRKPKAKLASGLDPLTRSELFCIKGRQRDRVAGVIIDDQYPNFKKNLEALISAKKCFWIVGQILPENEKLSDVYELMSAFLHELDTQDISEKNDRKISRKASMLRMGVLWRAIHCAGYEPRLFHCSSCGKKIQKSSKHMFSVPIGIYCDLCKSSGEVRDKMKISENAIKAIRIFLHKNPVIIAKVSASDVVIKELERVTTIFLQNVLNRRIIL